MCCDVLVLLVAGFLGGMLNAIAGGGSFLTLPALLFAGVSPVAANATGTAALLPAYIASAWRFRRDIGYPGGLGRGDIAALSLLGGSAGAILLVITADRLFSAIIPWLLLFATILFALGPRLMSADRSAPGPQDTAQLSPRPSRRRWLHALFLLLTCMYGGYFNGGLGILLLAVFSYMGQSDLHAMNGLKNAVSALLSCIAVLLYTWGGTIAFEYLPPLALAAILGGYTGAALAYRVSGQILRVVIVTIGGLLTLAFFLQP